MSVSSITSLSTAMATTQMNQEVGMAVLKKSMDIASSSASELLAAIPAPPSAVNLPANLGQHINTTA
jgi:hypothetical protein